MLGKREKVCDREKDRDEHRSEHPGEESSLRGCDHLSIAVRRVTQSPPMLR